VKALQHEGWITRAAVIDLDVHQGNGTACVFAYDPDVYAFSMHGARNYPFRKERSDLDVELADGCDDATYLSLLETHLGPVLDAARPDIVFYLGGADPYVHDRFGRLGLSVAGLGARDGLVFDACRRRGLPVVVTLAGGYAHDLEDIVRIQFNTVAAALAAYA
jgi:acetoin utilization deacetylase AcuC-like enzyme